MATPRVAAGVLFFDAVGRVLIVKPSYKDGWDIPGGYVEPSESPRAACIREIKEETGLEVSVSTTPLVIDWAPASPEGDKILFIFDGGQLHEEDQKSIRFTDGELEEWRFISPKDLDHLMPARLVRRIRTATEAKSSGKFVYAEHGQIPTLK